MAKSRLIILFFTFISIIIWVASGIFFTKPSIQVSPQLQEALSEINPDFDQETLNLVGSQVQAAPEVVNLIISSDNVATESAQ